MSENVLEYVLIAKYCAAAFVMGIGTVGPALAQGYLSAHACEATSKNPEARSDIFSMMLYGLVAIETSAIYALLIAFILLFVV